MNASPDWASLHRAIEELASSGNAEIHESGEWLAELAAFRWEIRHEGKNPLLHLWSNDATAPASPSPLCRLCRARTFAFARARNWAVYNESLTAAIMLLKYDEVTRVGDWFASRLSELHARLCDRDFAAWRADAVVPVPLYADRRRERGYNQVDMIARPLAKGLKLPFRPYLLARTKPRPARPSSRAANTGSQCAAHTRCAKALASISCAFCSSTM